MNIVTNQFTLLIKTLLHDDNYYSLHIHKKFIFLYKLTNITCSITNQILFLVSEQFPC